MLSIIFIDNAIKTLGYIRNLDLRFQPEMFFFPFCNTAMLAVFIQPVFIHYIISDFNLNYSIVNYKHVKYEHVDNKLEDIIYSHSHYLRNSLCLRSKMARSGCELLDVSH